MNKLESDPITDDEWLLRRVWVDQFRTDKTPLISPNAFEPRSKGRDIDTDGISLFRLDCLKGPEEILRQISEDKRPRYGIIRVQVSFIKSLQYSVASRPIPEISGHVVIPELNSDDYSANKGSFLSVKNALAEEASKEDNILIRPMEN